jgi:hypothetical protein
MDIIDTTVNDIFDWFIKNNEPTLQIGYSAYDSAVFEHNYPSLVFWATGLFFDLGYLKSSSTEEIKCFIYEALFQLENLIDLGKHHSPQSSESDHPSVTLAQTTHLLGIGLSKRNKNIYGLKEYQYFALLAMFSLIQFRKKANKAVYKQPIYNDFPNFQSSSFDYTSSIETLFIAQAAITEARCNFLFYKRISINSQEGLAAIEEEVNRRVEEALKMKNKNRGRRPLFLAHEELILEYCWKYHNRDTKQIVAARDISVKTGIECSESLFQNYYAKFKDNDKKYIFEKNKQ